MLNISRIADILNLFLMFTGSSLQLLVLPSPIKPDMILLVHPVLLLKMGGMACSEGWVWPTLTILYLMDTLRWFIYRYLNNKLEFLRQGYVVERSFVPVLCMHCFFCLICLKMQFFYSSWPFPFEIQAKLSLVNAEFFLIWFAPCSHNYANVSVIFLIIVSKVWHYKSAPSSATVQNHSSTHNEPHILLCCQRI